MKIEMIVEKIETGYSAYVETYPVYTVGRTFDELRANIVEAVNLLLDEQGERLSEDDVTLTLNLMQFSLYNRNR